LLPNIGTKYVYGDRRLPTHPHPDCRALLVAEAIGGNFFFRRRITNVIAAKFHSAASSPLGVFTMSTPEIHITAEKKSTSKTMKRKKGADKFQKSASAKRFRTSDASAIPDMDERASHVQSFRYLFSFGDGAQNPVDDTTSTAAQVEMDVDKTQVVSESTVKEPYRAVERQVRGNAGNFSLLGFDDGTESTADQEPTLSKSASNMYTPDLPKLDLVKTGNTRPSTAELALTVAPAELNVNSMVEDVHDGLAADSEADILALAMSFCGADRSVAELEEEWFNGGKRESIREDFRLKRMKRLRGRVQISL
jgi:hypothetical protein